MQDDPFFIERDISLYRAMLKLHMSNESRAAVLRSLAEAEHKLAVATAGDEPQAPRAAIG